MNGHELTELVARIGRLLVARGWTLGTAESCTGGLIGHTITSLPGSSEFYIGGVVAYSNSVKQRVLGVTEESLRLHGAVSSQVALAMAEGARTVLGADVVVSVTGVAGPSGGSLQKPVGTTYIALTTPRGAAVRHFLWREDRVRNKDLSAEAALALLEERLGD